MDETKLPQLTEIEQLNELIAEKDAEIENLKEMVSDRQEALDEIYRLARQF